MALGKYLVTWRTAAISAVVIAHALLAAVVVLAIKNARLVSGTIEEPLLTDKSWKTIAIGSMILMIPLVVAVVVLGVKHCQNGTDTEEDEALVKKKNQQNLKRWRIVTVLTMVLCAGLFIAIIVLAINNSQFKPDSERKENLQARGWFSRSAEPTSDPTVFSGLTEEDFEMITSTLLKDDRLNLTRGQKATTLDNYIYLIEDYLPPKAEVLAHLDGGGPMPARQAVAILYQGAMDPPQTSEYVVDTETGSVTHLRTHPWNGKPVDMIEAKEIADFLHKELHVVDYIFIESFNTSFKKDCAERCGWYLPIVRAQPNSPDRFIYLIVFGYPGRVLDPFLHSMNFIPVIKTDTRTQTKSFAKLYYNGKEFSDVQSLKEAYDSGSVKKVVVWNNTAEYYENNYGSPKRRHEDLNPDGKRPPFQVYPDQHRFTLENSHVSYLGWSFDIHVKTVTALELMDIRYKGERIAYSMGLQDIYVIYGGTAPGNYFRNFFDASFLIGKASKSLTRGVDCPHNALYMDARHYTPSSDGQTHVTIDAVCVFEHLNSVPLIRHLDPYLMFGLADSVLIVRQVVTFGNYDYVVDYEFHHTGVIEARASSTGYIETAIVQDYMDIDYGYLLDKQSYSIGIVHTHLFNLRVDLDINGTANRFTKVEYVPKTTQNPLDPSLEIGSIAVSETLVETETDAATNFDFDRPQHYVIQNKDAKNSAGNVRGYAVSSNSFVKMIVPNNDSRLNGAEWSKKQLFVTRYHDLEQTSVSFSTGGNPHNPVVDFRDFVDGESLVDEDLVTWITMGMHHAPLAEDIPVTTTPGKQLTVTLAPFNYYDDEPSIASSDAFLFMGGVLKEGVRNSELPQQCYSNPQDPFTEAFKSRIHGSKYI